MLASAKINANPTIHSTSTKPSLHAQTHPAPPSTIADDLLRLLSPHPSTSIPPTTTSSIWPIHPSPSTTTSSSLPSTSPTSTSTSTSTLQEHPTIDYARFVRADPGGPDDTDSLFSLPSSPFFFSSSSSSSSPTARPSSSIRLHTNHHPPTEREEEEEEEEPLSADEIFDLIRGINDPEHPLTLEQLAVVSRPQIAIHHPPPPSSSSLSSSGHRKGQITIEFTPTIPHCSMATLIGLTIRVRLLRALPDRWKVDIRLKEGSHNSELAVNKQLNDKERVAAALENPHLLGIVQSCLTPVF